MAPNPATEYFARQISELRNSRSLNGLFADNDRVRLAQLDVKTISELIKDQGPAYYFLIAAAGLNRTSLKKAAASPDSRLAPKEHRKAWVIQRRLPIEAKFSEIASSAVALRAADLDRKDTGAAERYFRERLLHEGVPLLMSPPVRRVPGLLIRQRKPDGVYPDPALGHPPAIYLEIKNLRRVADDIQKRLYEIAEVALEMKYLYGGLRLQGPLELSPQDVATASTTLQQNLREQMVLAKPVVIALLLCPKAEAQRYRDGAQAFIDFVFFEEEIDDCIACLKRLTAEAAR